MNETIRDRLKRQMWIALGGNSAIIVVWYLAMTFVVRPPGWMHGRTEALTSHDSFALSIWCLAPVVAAGTWLFVMTRFQCPRCTKVFGYQFSLRAGLGRPGPQRPDSCPSCGVSLDAPWP